MVISFRVVATGLCIVAMVVHCCIYAFGQSGNRDESEDCEETIEVKINGKRY